jgi:hypothetical protein
MKCAHSDMNSSQTFAKIACFSCGCYSSFVCRVFVKISRKHNEAPVYRRNIALYPREVKSLTVQLFDPAEITTG